MTYYHASARKLRILEPRVSEQGVPLIWFSDRRENVLVYLSNAVEKTCREAGFPLPEDVPKWGPYGFEADGRFRFEEYYPNALEDTYRGVSGYIYTCRQIVPCRDLNINIPHVHITRAETPVDEAEYIPDACQALLEAERAGLITVLRYREFRKEPKRRAWLLRTVTGEYEHSAPGSPYRFFLEAKFPNLIGCTGESAPEEIP